MKKPSKLYLIPILLFFTGAVFSNSNDYSRYFMGHELKAFEYAYLDLVRDSSITQLPLSNDKRRVDLNELAFEKREYLKKHLNIVESNSPCNTLIESFVKEITI